VRYVFAGLLCLLTIACREIEPYNQSSSMKGYQFNGIITDSAGYVLRDVVVSLYYYYDSVAATPTDTQQVIVTDSMKIVDISVYTLQYEFIRTLFLGRMPQTGPIRRQYWNGRNSQNQQVGSGMYLIRYYVDTAVVKFSPIVIDGAPTDTTDRLGHFAILKNNLPIGEQFDYYDSSRTFKAVYKILPMIKLNFQYQDRSVTYDSIQLVKGKITNGSFIL
jgi:hypothetical protein